MYLKILACDLDGTLAENGVVAESTWVALRTAHSAGLKLMLVTGRTLDSFAADGPFAELFEAIVAENGAAVYFTRNDSVVLPFGRLAPEVRRLLEQREVPLELGVAIVATWLPHIEAVDEVLRETGRGATVEYNKNAVMILPPGATKGTGLAFALHELSYSPRNVVAVGDAENDRSLFEVAELAVAVSNAVPSIIELADYVLPHANGRGVARLIDELSTGRVAATKVRPERQLHVGQTLSGETVEVQPGRLLRGNLGVLGASGSGKSWLAGLIAEELLKHHYQLCIIDPEGDYTGLRAFPHTVVLGGTRSKVPPVADVVALLAYSGVSLILDLSSTDVPERERYVIELLQELRSLRATRGRPHWFLLDEIHSFCPPEGGALTDLVAEAMHDGGFGVVSYRPSLVASAVTGLLDQWLLTRITCAKEIDHLKSMLPKVTCSHLDLNALRTLPLGGAFLCSRGDLDQASQADTVRFRTQKRSIPHVRHLHKYLRAVLPEPKRFYFQANSSHPIPRFAASLWEFREAMAEIPFRTLRYHLDRGDFERWLNEVLHDDELSRRVRKIRHRHLEPDCLRAELTATVANRYEELESML